MANENIKKELTGFATIDKPWLKQYPKYDETNHTPFITGKSVWDVTEEKLEEYSDVPFIEYFGNNISREDFAEYVVTWAKTFRALGVEPGEHIPLYVPATPESFAMFFGAIAIGATPYFQKLSISKAALEQETKEAKIAVVFDGLWKNVSDIFSQDRFKKVIVTSAADSMMFPLRQISKLKSYFDNRKSTSPIPKTSKYIWTDDAKKLANYYTGEYKVPFEPGRIAAITTSSGTTSHVVKGIMDTNEGILASLACTMDADTGFTKGKRTLTCFPPTASTSINCLQLLPTFTGGTIVFDPRVDISQWYNQLMKYKPDITISTGSVWERFVNDLLAKEKNGKKHDLTWVDYFIMGGAGTTHDTLNWMNDTLRERGAQRDISVGYGFSEVFGVLSVAKYNGNYDERKNNKDVISVGIPLPGYNVGIFDENGNELPYGKGYRGELWIKAPSNMHGYYGKPDVTNKTLIDGWLHSGDLCEIDEDGNIFFYGRLKNSAVINNKKEYLFDIANDIRLKFNLHDVIVEKKNLEDNNISLVMYFVQKIDSIVDSEILIRDINKYLNSKNITIDGYKEFTGSLPIDPTTLKPRTKDTDGFISYEGINEYDVSYEEVSLDIYKKNINKKNAKTFVR